MRTLLKLIFFSCLLGAVALLGFAIFSELPTPQRVVVIPLELQ